MAELTAADWGYWYGHWSHAITCARCGAIMHVGAPCPVCGEDYTNLPDQEVHVAPGVVLRQPPVFAGADVWSYYVLLRLMYDEWNRPTIGDQLAGLPQSKRPSPHLVIVILFWSLFESLMQRLLEKKASMLPPAIAEDLLRRYSTIGSRMDSLYKLLVGSTLRVDLTAVDAADVYDHLKRVQEGRNRFIHGEPEVINADLVDATVDKLPAVQGAWIRLYNLRCASPR